MKTLVALLLTAPLAAQTTQDSVVCKACVPIVAPAKVDSTPRTVPVVVYDRTVTPGVTTWRDSTVRVMVIVPPKDTTPPVVVVPPGKWNEPAGYTTITDNPFNAVTALGWRPDAGKPTLGTDATAPVSPSSVMVANQSGQVSGGAPWTLEDAFSTGYSSVYGRITFKLSAGYQGDLSGTNKLFFLWTSSPTFFLSAQGVGSGPLTATVRVQGNGSDYQPAGQSISRGVWHTWEFVVTAPNKVTWWLDGVLQGSRSDAPFYGGNTFTIASLSAIWGGVSGKSAPSGQSIMFDHLYLSGKK